MPTNLATLIRFRTIDKCLRDKTKQWSWQRLAEACELALSDEIGLEKNLSRRTIMYDINHMKSGELGYHAPIVYNRSRRSYEYSEPDFETSISDRSLDEIKQALIILKQFGGQDEIGGIGSVIAKLKHAINVQAKSASEIIEFQHAVTKHGQGWLTRLYDAIDQKVCLELVLNSQKADEPPVAFSPYFLKEYQNQWFVIGLDHQAKSVRTIALRNLAALKESLLGYKRKKSQGVIASLSQQLGVHVSTKSTPVQIVIQGNAELLMAQPIHAAQVVEKSGKKNARVTVELVPNPELVSKLLSYGSHIEVLQPEELRQSLRDELERTAQKYAEPTPAKKRKSKKKSKKKK